MKKSEVVYKLTKFGVDNELFDLRDNYPETTAKQIIDFLGKIGMKPPDNGKHPFQSDDYLPNHEWDSEDV